MPSDDQNRIDDTVAYLQTHNLDPHGFTAAAARLQIKTLSPLISIGGFRGPKLFQKDSKTQQRRALRALMLTYLTRGHMPHAQVDALKSDFMEQPEWLIKSQIQWMVTHTNTTDAQARQNAANTAIAAANAGTFQSANGCNFNTWNFYPTGGATPGGGLNCYGAVLYWLFLGGAFSHRWLLPLITIDNSQNAIDAAVTGGVRPAAMPQLTAHNAGALAAGRAILLYTRGMPLGHVVISNGAGGFISNNTPLGSYAVGMGNDLFDCQNVFAGIDRNALHHHRPVQLTFNQLQNVCAVNPPGGYLGYAILDTAFAPWEGRPSWNR